MSGKLTPWFPGSIKPVRTGVYQQMAKGVIGYQLWTGSYWSLWHQSASVAAQCKDYSWFQNDPWRGLAQDPAQKGGAA
jgi:hypothetical protein